MGFLETRAGLKFLNPRDPRRAACVRDVPERVVLDVMPGVLPSGKPPVRVFLGTEPAQYRAERVFVWSIERTRDPSRVYEITLMKDLVGFDRRGWTTGFTNYRFAVPHLAGGAGRAIFNDVDEAYFSDPAELFDAEMGEHGYLATSDTETSVMLIDCARMASVWSLEAAQYELKKRLLARTLKTPGIRGDLPAEWTARDEEFALGHSKLQHWTTLHTQPWRPVPQRFAYEPNSTGQLWFDLKRSADAVGYQVFNASRPSSLYTILLERLRSAPRRAAAVEPLERARTASGAAACGLAELIAEAGEGTLLDYQLGRELVGDPSGGTASGAAQPDVTRFDPVFAASSRPSPADCDGVVCTEVLEYLPDEDVPWLVDELFARARKFVYAVVAVDVRGETLSDGSRLESEPRDPSWWSEVFESAGRRCPELHWTLVLLRRSGRGPDSVQVRDGGRRFGGSPTVWVLTSDPCQDTSQSLTLAESLGVPYSRKDLRFSALARLPNRLLGATRIGVDRARSPELLPPWPDIVVASERCCVPVARWIRRLSFGRTRLVQVGCPGGEAADLFDAVVTPAHYRLWPHPRRIETAVPLTRPTALRQSSLDESGRDDPDHGRHPWAGWLRSWVAARARARPLNARGTPRPQQGLEYLCARLIERGFVRPPTDPPDLHQAPHGLGAAAPLGVPRDARARSVLRDPDEVAGRVWGLLGYSWDGRAAPSGAEPQAGH